jgi:ribosome modulation factor
MTDPQPVGDECACARHGGYLGGTQGVVDEACPREAECYDAWLNGFNAVSAAMDDMVSLTQEARQNYPAMLPALEPLQRPSDLETINANLKRQIERARVCRLGHGPDGSPYCEAHGNVFDNCSLPDDQIEFRR